MPHLVYNPAPVVGLSSHGDSASYAKDVHCIATAAAAAAAVMTAAAMVMKATAASQTEQADSTVLNPGPSQHLYALL